MKPTTHNTKRCPICGYRVRGKSHESGKHHTAAVANRAMKRKAVKE